MLLKIYNLKGGTHSSPPWVPQYQQYSLGHAYISSLFNYLNIQIELISAQTFTWNQIQSPISDHVEAKRETFYSLQTHMVSETPLDMLMHQETSICPLLNSNDTENKSITVRDIFPFYPTSLNANPHVSQYFKNQIGHNVSI